MTTEIYFIRHAESPFVHGQEKERGLSEDGKKKSEAVAEALQHVSFSCIASSSYQRAVDTVYPLAQLKQMAVQPFEELVERPIKGLDYKMEWSQLEQAIKRSFEDIDYCLEGGESTKSAQARAIPTIEKLLLEHAGKAIALGTHGNIMTIILKHYDETIGYEFWENSCMPDIYKASFEGNRLMELSRVNY